MNFAVHITLLLSVSTGITLCTEPGFVSLFDGKSFTGWKHSGNWIIEDGAFYRKASGGSLTYTEALVPDDFELRFEWKVSKGCNSGIYYRPRQYEYQILDNQNSPYGENPRQSAGSLFFCMAPSMDATKPFGEWNTGRVKCKGTIIEHWVNGERVLSFDYRDPKWTQQVDLLKTHLLFLLLQQVEERPLCFELHHMLHHLDELLQLASKHEQANSSLNQLVLDLDEKQYLL